MQFRRREPVELLSLSASLQLLNSAFPSLCTTAGRQARLQGTSELPAITPKAMGCP